MRPLVLVYHGVAEDDPPRLSVRRRELEAQVGGLLARGYRPVDAATAATGSGRTLHVTFDDAFRSAAAVLPLLLGLGLRLTVFACTAYARDGRPFDVPELADDVRAAPAAFETMGWDALRSAVADGVEVASHTVTHPHLPRLSDAELARELTESKSELEDELGVPCRHLAYPYGDEDARVRAAARAAGYDAAFAVATRRPDRFAVPRVAVYRHHTRLGFRLRTSGLAR